MNKTEIVAYYCDVSRERTTYAFYHMNNPFSQNSNKCGTFIRNDEPTVTHHSVQALPLSKISLFKQPLVEEELCYPLHSLFLGRKVWCMLTVCLVFVFQGLFLLGVKFFRCMGNTHLKYSCFSKSLKCTSKS